MLSELNRWPDLWNIPIFALAIGWDKMEDSSYKDRTSLVKGAKDIAKEVKKQTVKKVNQAVDRAQDEYTQRSYSRFQDEDEDDDYSPPGETYNAEANDDEGSSEATEGHDEDDEIYEGEYQGIPSMNQGKDSLVSVGQPKGDEYKDRRELESERKADEEELAQQYELIIQECGHGRFQWALFFVLGLALMADGVEVFVVGFVLPSAETDLCIPNSGSGWLGECVMSGRSGSRCICGARLTNRIAIFCLSHCIFPNILLWKKC